MDISGNYRNRVENEFNAKGTLISRYGNGDAKRTVKLEEDKSWREHPQIYRGEYVRDDNHFWKGKSLLYRQEYKVPSQIVGQIRQILFHQIDFDCRLDRQM